MLPANVESSLSIIVPSFISAIEFSISVSLASIKYSCFVMVFRKLQVTFIPTQLLHQFVLRLVNFLVMGEDHLNLQSGVV